MKRIKYGIIVLVIIGGALLLSSILSSKNKGDLRSPAKTGSAKERTLRVINKKQPSLIETSGRMFAFEKVELYSEVSGTLERSSLKFKSGAVYKKGEVMISVNSDVFRNSLLAQKSYLLNQLTILLPDMKVDFPESYQAWENYINNLDIQKPIPPLPETKSKKEKFYVTYRNIYKLFYDIKSMEATFKKYTIEAMFDGVVTQANINPGTLVRNGQKLGVFVNNSLFEMSAPIKLKDLNKISVGMSVNLKAFENDKIIKGKIVRINRAIDQQTQTVNAFIQSKDKRILDGMYFDATIKSVTDKKLAKVPVEAIRNGNQIAVKYNGTTKLTAVKIVEKNSVECLVDGLPDNSLIVIPAGKN